MKYPRDNIRKTVKDVFESDTPIKEWRDTQSVINDGFPGTFNLSFNEPELLSEYGQYLEYDHNLYFGKIQNVIRHNDLSLIINENDEKHLSLFELAGFSFIDTSAEKLEENVQLSIRAFARILFDELKLDPQKFYVKVCAGGIITDLTDGRYKIERKIPKDSLTYKEWKKCGAPEENFIWDSTRNTFLSLFMFARSTPWGYRNELLYDVGMGNREEDMLDIGTIEYFPWKPVFEDGKRHKKRYYMIRDIEPWKHSVVVGGLGIERLIMAANNLRSAMQCDHIQTTYQNVLKDAENKNERAAFLFVDTLRTLQQIITDSDGYKNLTKSRRTKTVDYATALFNATEQLGVEVSKNLKKYLKELDSSSQKNIGKEDREYKYTAREIQRIFDTRLEEFPIWPRAEFHSAEDGFEQVVDEIMEEKGTEVYAIVPQYLLNKIPESATRFRERRIRNDIKLKVIVGKEGREIKERHKHDKEELREIRFSDFLIRDLNTAIYIYRNKVAVLSIAKFGEGGMIIENREYAELMRRSFEFMWRKLEKQTQP